MNADEYSEIAARAAELARRIQLAGRNEALENRKKLILYNLQTASRLAREAAEWLVEHEEKVKGAGQ